MTPCVGQSQYPKLLQTDFTKYIPSDFFTSVSCDQHWVWLASQNFTLKKTNFVQLGCLCVCREGSSPVASLLPYSRSIALPEKVQASLSTPLFASIALASRSKEAGLSSLPPGASRSQRRFISSSISSISIFYLIVLQLCWLPAHTHTRVPDTKSETRKLKFSIQFNFQRTILLRMLAWRGSSDNCD